jgi:hypothetical protein
MVRYVANLGEGGLLLVHQEDAPDGGVPLPPTDRPYIGRPRYVEGPFAGEHRHGHGVSWSGGWKNLDAAIDAIGLRAKLKPQMVRVWRTPPRGAA